MQAKAQPIRCHQPREIAMTKYKVGLHTNGGKRIEIIVDATSPDKAKEAAVAMANAQAKAKGESYVYHATSASEA
jgi:hypothetical protein